MKKVYLCPKLPTKDVPVSDQKRIALSGLRRRYPLCRNTKFIPHTDMDRYPN